MRVSRECCSRHTSALLSATSSLTQSSVVAVMSSAVSPATPASYAPLVSPVPSPSPALSDTNGLQQSTSNSSSPALPTRELSGDELLSALVHQLEWYFSKENLVKDAFLLSQLSSGGVPVDVICSFRKVQALTSDKSLVLQAMRRCRSLQLDAAQTMVKPISRAERNVLILRDMPSSLSNDAVGAIFAVDGCPGEVRSVRSEVGDCWFVQFETEDQCMDTALWLTGQQFQGKAIHARVKSVMAPTAVLAAASREQPRPVSGDGQPGSIYTGGSVTTPLMSPTGSGQSASTTSNYSSSHFVANPNTSPSAPSMTHPSAMYYQPPPPAAYSPYQYPSPYFMPSYPNQPMSAYQMNGYPGQPYAQQQQQQQAGGAGQYGGHGRGGRPNGHYGQGGKRYIAHNNNTQQQQQQQQQHQQGQPSQSAVNASNSHSSAMNGKAGSPSAAGKQPAQQQQQQPARKKKGNGSSTDGLTPLPNGHTGTTTDSTPVTSTTTTNLHTVGTAPTSVSVYDQPGVAPANLSSSLAASTSSPSIPPVQPLRLLSGSANSAVNGPTSKAQPASAATTAAVAGAGKKKKKGGAAGETSVSSSAAAASATTPPAAVLDTNQFPALPAAGSSDSGPTESTSAVVSPVASFRTLPTTTTSAASPAPTSSSHSSAGTTSRSPAAPATTVGPSVTTTVAKASGWASIVTASQHVQPTMSKPASAPPVASNATTSTASATGRSIAPHATRVTNADKKDFADSRTAAAPNMSSHSNSASSAASPAASSSTSNSSSPSTSSGSSSSSSPLSSVTASPPAPPVMNYARMVGSMSAADAARLEEQVKAARLKKAQQDAAQAAKDDRDKENKGEAQDGKEGETKGDGAVEGELSKEQHEKRAKRSEAARAERRVREEERERDNYARYQAKKQLQAAGGEQEERQNHTAGERRDRDRSRVDRADKPDSSFKSGYWRGQNGVDSAPSSGEERSWRRLDRREEDRGDKRVTATGGDVSASSLTALSPPAASATGSTDSGSPLPQSNRTFSYAEMAKRTAAAGVGTGNGQMSARAEQNNGGSASSAGSSGQGRSSI